jgi:teichuronic acid biosynthesis protein TuaF
MENILNLLLNRIKKSIPLLIIIPLLLAGLGYFFEMKSEPVVSYAARAKIELGFYNYNEKIIEKMNNAEGAKGIITSNSFLESTFPDYEPEELEALRSGIVINTLSSTSLELIYRSDNEEEVEEGLERLVDAFLVRDNEELETKLSNAKDRLKTLNSEPLAVEETIVDRENAIYEFEDIISSYYPAEVTEPVVVGESRSEDLSSKKRAVLGGLIGVTIVFGYIVVPLLFREEDM